MTGSSVSVMRNETSARAVKRRTLRPLCGIHISGGDSCRCSIEERLIEMGYSKADFTDTYDEAWYPLVNQPRPLTARSEVPCFYLMWPRLTRCGYVVWKKIQPQLVLVIEQQKQARIQRAKDELHNLRIKPLYERYKLYVATLPENEGPLPPCDMLALTEPVKALLEREDDGLPISDAEMDTAIPEATQRYSAEARSKLLSLLREARWTLQVPPPTGTRARLEDEDAPNVGADHEEFRWATSFFRCDFCERYGDALKFPNLIRHIREEHLWSTTPAWRLTIWPLEYNRTLTYPCAHPQGVQVAIQALRHLHLPESTLFEQVNKRLGELRNEWESDAVPTSFCLFVLQKCLI